MITTVTCKSCKRHYNAVFLRCPYCKSKNTERGEMNTQVAALFLIVCAILALIASYIDSL